MKIVISVTAIILGSVIIGFCIHGINTAEGFVADLAGHPIGGSAQSIERSLTITLVMAILLNVSALFILALVFFKVKNLKVQIAGVGIVAMAAIIVIQELARHVNHPLFRVGDIVIFNTPFYMFNESTQNMLNWSAFIIGLGLVALCGFYAHKLYNQIKEGRSVQ